MDLEQTLSELFEDKYADIVKYVVMYPGINVSSVVKAEHPTREPDIIGNGDTWAIAAKDCLRQVIFEYEIARFRTPRIDPSNA
jgi:hypothetical protein